MHGTTRCAAVLVALVWSALVELPAAAQQQRPPTMVEILEQSRVIQVLDTYATSIVQRDIAKLMGLIGDQATLVSKLGKGTISKSAFRKELESASIKQLIIRDLEYRLEGPRSATVVGTEELQLGEDQRSERLRWSFEKRGDNWLIVGIRRAGS